MRAFIFAVAALLVISVGAGVILTSVDQTIGQATAKSSVRLGE